MVRISDIHDLIIQYIENSKLKGIEYKDSLKTMEEILDEIKNEYKDLEEEIEVI
jgi:archaellum component FlaC